MVETPFGSSHLRILVLAPFTPRLDTPHGGGRVLAQFLHQISQRHHVALLYFRASDDPPIDPILLDQLDLTQAVTRTWAGPSGFQKIIQLLRLAGGLLRGKPMWVTDWESRQYSRFVRLVARSWQPDLVQIEFHIMAQYLNSLKDCQAPRILVEYEVAKLAGPFLQNGPPFLQSLAHRIDRSAWKKFESGIIRQVHAVVTFTPKDREAIAHYGLTTPLWLIPFGTVLFNQPSIPTDSDSLSLLFVGNFIHSPNREAAIRLVRTIFPAVRKNFPNLTCVIIGPNPPKEITQQAGDRVIITGWVPEVAPYYERAALFVAPIDSGGGMRVKILEAMAAGKAIVATPLAVEGLKIEDGQHLILAKSDTEIIAQIERLLADPKMRTTLASNAHIWACANLNWEKSILEYERLYQTLLNEDKA